MDNGGGHPQWRRARFRVAAGMLLLVGLPLLVAALWPRSAWDRAVPVPLRTDWLRGCYDYAWLSDHELLCLHYEGRRKPSRAFCVDTRTGKQAVVAPALLDWAALPSPDKRWLLWDVVSRRPDGTGTRQAYGFAPLQPSARPGRGRFRSVWPASLSYGHTRDFAWLPNGQGWVEIRWPGSRERSSSVRLAEYRKDERALVRTWQLPLWVNSIRWVLGVASSGQVLAASDGHEHSIDDEGGSDLFLLDRSQTGDTAGVHARRIPSPPGSGWWIADAQLSPDRTRIAWLYVRVRSSSLMPFLDRLHNADYRGTLEHRLRVTDTRGVLLRDLGGKRRTLYGQDLSERGGLRWLPDGKRLSIRSWNRDASAGTLWTLPAQ